MNYDSPETVEMIAYDLKLGNWPAALKRLRINDIANGKPPYTEEEVRENDIKININDLEHTRSCQHARAQFYSANLKPAHFFQAKTDSGPKHKRQEWNTIATSQAARVMKRSLPYFESLRSRFALDVLHGIGPSAWEDRDKWCPDPLGIEDALLPAGTLLTMKNLPFFFIYKSWTAPELIKMTTGPRVDPGWNLPLVQSCLEWIDSEMMQLRNNNWPEWWSPEKQGERIKAGEWYAGDQAPRIDCFDFYFWSDQGRDHGWRRRTILDPWSTPEAAGGGWSMTRRSGKPFESRRPSEERDGFLFNPGKRKYASKLSELINFQFADLSAVAPFRVDTVRSLGWLLFATCHMQNRLRCAVNTHIFENLMQFYRGSSEEDFQRALKVELINHGFIDKSIEMIPQAERWQINAALAEMGLQENKQIISNAASAWAQNSNFSNDRTEKTKFQVMAEVSAMTSMISAGLLQAYAYQEFEYREIWRRLCRKNSRDPDVREFRANCLRLGIPEEYLIAEAWDIEAERVMGAGNKTMELAIAEQLLQMRNLYDPAAQREILRDATLLITDDAVRTRAYVPDGPRPVSNSQHDAELAMGVILQGHKVTPVEGENHIEVVEVWLRELGTMVANAQKRGGMATAQEIAGMRNLEVHIKAQVAMIAKDEEEKDRVKKYMDALGKLMNFVKAFEQRLQEAQQKAAEAAQAGNGGLDPKDRAKIVAIGVTAQAKAQNLRESHGLKMAQRKLQFEQQLHQDQLKTQSELVKEGVKTAAEIRREEARNRMKSFSE